MAKPVLVCFSLLYLFTAVFLAVYKCRCRSSIVPIQHSVFTYPSSYGEQKHAIPTQRSSCHSPLFFSDYSVVAKHLEESCRSSGGLGSANVRYMQRDAQAFGGNFSSSHRFSYFRSNNYNATPCGFLKKLAISYEDEAAMASCGGVVVVSAIFGDHDKIRQPRGLGARTVDSVCFFMFVDDVTLRGLADDHNLAPSRRWKKIGVWRVVRVGGSLYGNAAMNGVVYKHLVHRLFPESKYSIWVDGKLQLVVDPLLLIHALVVKEGVDMAVSRHPFFRQTVEEAVATARWNKWPDVQGLRDQIQTYCRNGLQPWSSDKPYPSDVPDSALIIRKHSKATNLFSCLLFNELEGYNPRDQLAFAYVRDLMKPRLKLNMFEVQVFEQVAIEYRHSLNKGPKSGPKTVTPSFHSIVNHTVCENYFYKMTHT